jgi:hypothetical protein
MDWNGDFIEVLQRQRRRSYGIAGSVGNRRRLDELLVSVIVDLFSGGSAWWDSSCGAASLQVGIDACGTRDDFGLLRSVQGVPILVLFVCRPAAKSRLRGVLLPPRPGICQCYHQSAVRRTVRCCSGLPICRSTKIADAFRQIATL